MLLGVSRAINVADIGEVELKSTSKNILIVEDVMHTHEIIKNLVSKKRVEKAYLRVRA